MKQSAGILLYKRQNAQLQFLLVHPGGPFWKNKEAGSWSIPKGEFTDEESAFDAAIREFAEETGVKLDGDFIELKSVKLKSGKTVYAWALERDIDANAIVSNTFEIEWPPKSGKRVSIPEVDKAGWFGMFEALEKINPAQGNFIIQVAAMFEFL